MKVAFATLACCFLSSCAMHGAPFASTPSAGTHTANMILVRQSTKSSDQVVDAIKAYAESQKWAYLGANKVKGGEVTLVKVCIPAVGGMVWGAGLEYSALLPCGNLAVYQKAGRTEVSMLDPRYMGAVAPRAETTRAGEMALPLLTQMLDSAAK